MSRLYGDTACAQVDAGIRYQPSPEYTTALAPQRVTAFGEQTERARSQNRRLADYVIGLETLVERVFGPGRVIDKGKDTAEGSASALGEIDATLTHRADLLDRLENAFNSLDSLA